MTRTKFKCESVEQRFDEFKNKFLFSAKFQVVLGDSPENKEFFKYTPNGKIELGVYEKNIFTPGKEYYVDFTEA